MVFVNVFKKRRWVGIGWIFITRFLLFAYMGGQVASSLLDLKCWLKASLLKSFIRFLKRKLMILLHACWRHDKSQVFLVHSFTYQFVLFSLMNITVKLLPCHRDSAPKTFVTLVKLISLSSVATSTKVCARFII